MADYSSIAHDKQVPDYLDTAGSEQPYPSSRYVIEIDLRDGSVELDVVTEYTSNPGVPESVWNGRVRRYTISNVAALDRDALAEDLKEGGKLAVLIDQIIAGGEDVWDGSNYRGRLSGDAQDAEYDLNRLLELHGDCYADPDKTVWDCENWLYGGMSRDALLSASDLSATSTDEQIRDAGSAAERQAESDDIILVGDSPYEVLKAAIDEARRELADDAELEVVRSDQGDGGWSIHVEDDDDPGNWVLCGPSEWDERYGDWIRPTEADLDHARDLIREGRRNVEA